MRTLFDGSLAGLLAAGCLAAAAASPLWAAPSPAAPSPAAPPHRVVSQSVGTDDLLLTLAGPGQIAALSHLSRDPSFSAVAAQAKGLPTLKTSDAESVLVYRPDLVLAASYTNPATLALLRRSGLRLIVIDRFDTLEDAYQNLRTVGAALGHPERAEAVIKSTKQRVEALAARLGGVKPVRVLAVSTYPFTAGSQTTFQDLCEHAGALNVAAEAGLVGHAPTPEEKLLTWNAEVLIASGEERDGLEARLRQLPAYRALPALQAGRLLLLPGALMSNVSHLRVDAYELLARRLHPERFAAPGK